MKTVGIIHLPVISDPRGNLTVIEGDNHIPFSIARVYYLYDVPGGSERGAHAHKRLEQFIVAVSGSFDVLVDDGTKQTNHHLNRSNYGLYLPSMTWRSMDNFSSGSVCLVLASARYDEEDYYRNYDDFKRACGLI